MSKLSGTTWSCGLERSAKFTPGLDATEAKFTVSAAMTLIGNAIRIGSVRRRADLADRLTEICIALMTETSDPAASLVDAGVGATP